jgi:membrane-bound ClpP family serine protease
MVCEFLSKEYKKRLMKIAEVKDLMSIGYTRKSAYNSRLVGIISDERCEKLVYVLGERAIPILEEALHEFKSQVEELKRSLRSSLVNSISR